jgi:hypothetical protein
LAADSELAFVVKRLGLSVLGSAALILAAKVGIYYILTDEQRLVRQGFLPRCTKTELQFSKGYSRSEDGSLIYTQDWKDVCIRKVWVRNGEIVLDNPDSIHNALQSQGH